jgi:conjugal transfer/entry exclusion protein
VDFIKGEFCLVKGKHLKQGEKISNLENASQNLTHLPLTILQKTLKRISKTKQVVQAWSKILNWKKAIHAYLL